MKSVKSNVSESIATRLKELREKKGLSYAKLAQSLNVSAVSLGYYERGERVPDAITIDNICDFFNVSSDYLLGRSDVKNTNEDFVSACKFTGLSEKAMQVLICGNTKYKLMFNRLLESEYYTESEPYTILTAFFDYLNTDPFSYIKNCKYDKSESKDLEKAIDNYIMTKFITAIARFKQEIYVDGFDFDFDERMADIMYYWPEDKPCQDQ